MAAGEFKPYVPAETSMREFTIQALFIGLVMCIVLGAANAYLGLKAGMTIAATYPAAVIGMAILRITRGTILEENFARTVGSTGATISEIESGKRAPRVKLLIAIADHFGVSADYLLGRAVHAEDLPDDLRELFQLAVDAGYAADLKDFFRWLKAKR